MTKYVIDIDGTICTITNGKYQLAEPFEDRIRIVNRLFEEGHEIVYFTARGMGSSNDNIILAHIKWSRFTRKQLALWGAKYHKLYLGKPSADIYVDDKSISEEFFFDS